MKYCIVLSIGTLMIPLASKQRPVSRFKIRLVLAPLLSPLSSWKNELEKNNHPTNGSKSICGMNM